MLSTNIRLSHKYRFVASTAFNGQIFPIGLIGACGGVCTVTNTTISLLVESLRLKKIEVWSAPATQGASSTCTVEWSGSDNSPNVEVSDTTISVARNAHLVTSPPNLSLASFWTTPTSSNALFSLTCPINSIIDIWLDEVLADQASALGTTTVATGVLGELYFLPLDGTTTHLLIPVSLNTTF